MWVHWVICIEMGFYWPSRGENVKIVSIIVIKLHHRQRLYYLNIYVQLSIDILIHFLIMILLVQ